MIHVKKIKKGKLQLLSVRSISTEGVTAFGPQKQINNVLKETAVSQFIRAIKLEKQRGRSID